MHGAPKFGKVGTHLEKSIPIQGSIKVSGKAYTVVKSLGEGAYGRAYAARITATPRRKLVVVKTFSTKNDATVTAYKNEVTVLKKFGNLISHDDAAMVIVQKKIRGITLLEKLRTVKSPKEVEKLLAQYMKTLEEFQRKSGLAHGDFHPGNIMYYKGKMTPIDFGLAKPADAFTSILFNGKGNGP